jgi:hypothetical protein
MTTKDRTHDLASESRWSDTSQLTKNQIYQGMDLYRNFFYFDLAHYRPRTFLIFSRALC